MKICMFYDVTCTYIESLVSIDPHFSRKSNSPFARFEPTPGGWNAAIFLANTLL